MSTVPRKHRKNVQAFFASHNMGFTPRSKRKIIFIGQLNAEQRLMYMSLVYRDYNVEIMADLNEFREKVKTEDNPTVVCLSPYFIPPRPRRGTVVLSYGAFLQLYGKKYDGNERSVFLLHNKLIMPVVSLIFEGRRVLISSKGSNRVLRTKVAELNGIVMNEDMDKLPDFVIIDDTSDFNNNAVVRNLLNFSGIVKFRNVKLIHELWNNGISRALQQNELDNFDEGGELTLVKASNDQIVLPGSSLIFYLARHSRAPSSFDLVQNVLFIPRTQFKDNLIARKRTAYCIKCSTHETCSFSHFPLIVLRTSPLELFTYFDVNLVGFDKDETDYLSSVLISLGANKTGVNDIVEYRKAFKIVSRGYVIGLDIMEKSQWIREQSKVPVLTYQYLQDCGTAASVVMPSARHQIPISNLLLTEAEHENVLSKFDEYIREQFFSTLQIFTDVNKINISLIQMEPDLDLFYVDVTIIGFDSCQSILERMFRNANISTVSAYLPNSQDPQKTYIFATKHIDDSPVPVAIILKKDSKACMCITHMAYEVFVDALRNIDKGNLENLSNFNCLTTSTNDEWTPLKYTFCCKTEGCQRTYLEDKGEILGFLADDGITRNSFLCLNCKEQRSFKCIVRKHRAPEKFFWKR